MSQATSAGNSSNSVLGRILRLFLPIAVICIGGAGLLYQAEVETDLTKVRSAEATMVRLGVGSIGRVVQSITSDLAYLATQEGVVGSIPHQDRTTQDHLLTNWLAFSRTKGIYDQIRWLDTDGQERIRVNFNDGEPAGVPEGKLQNKGKRYYFADTIKLNRGEFFISPLDLNIERGEIEQPLKPTIRIGTPVFDRDGKKQGIVLLNYLGGRMLREFGRMMGESLPRSWIVNRDGYWLKGPSADLEWGFMYQRPEASMAHRHPEAWKRILAAEHGQFEDDEGLWTFATVYPLVEGQKTSSGARRAFSPSRSAMESRDYFWKTALLLPKEEYRATMWRTGVNLSAATALLLAGLFMGCWRLTNIRVREKEAKAEAEKANQIKSNFLASMSHDLRTPLNAILGFSEMMRERSFGPLGDPHYEEYANDIHDSGRLLLSLINDILDLSKIEAVKYDLVQETLDISSLIQLSFRQLKNMAEASNQTLSADVPANMPALRGDERALVKVFNNLLSNAIKFTPDGGKIDVTAKVNEAGEIVLGVTDTGIGMSENDIDKALKPFEQANPTYSRRHEGTGLGLHLCVNIMELFGGTLAIESKVDHGTTVTVFFPPGRTIHPS
jgi:signal transduction histidine kinase